jgi:hypothetical protein
MAGTVGERVAEARRRAFVGRAQELAFFGAWIDGREPATAVLAVHGPAGIGKSTLLRRFADDAATAGLRVLAVDARDLPPVPGGLATALDPLRAAPAGPAVLLIDTIEALTDAETVLSELLAALPADVLVVVAGQHPPSARWRTDPGWSDVVRVVRLGTFSEAECRDFLAARRLDLGALSDVVAATHGHPLALALLAEVMRAGGSAAAGPTPDLVRDLLDRLLAAVPTPAHRRALEAAAQVRALTEPLLAALLFLADAAEPFDWLRGLPFVESTPAGLVLHDLVRDAVGADLRWRDAARVRAIRERARAYHLARLDEREGDPAAAVLDLMFLHDDFRAMMRGPEAGVGAGLLRLGSLRPGDADEIRAAVERNEGRASALLAERWLAAQPGGWTVVRAADGTVAGFLCALSLTDAEEQQRAWDDGVDPAVLAAVRHLRSLPPLRGGERAQLFRFWMSAETYQSASPVQSLLAAQLARTFLTTPGLAVSLLACADPARWADFCRYADQRRMPGADFDVGGRTYAVFGHDWRAVPPAAWLAVLARREAGAGPGEDAPAPPPGAVRVLAREEFAAAVRDGLRGVTRRERLAANPLLDSRLVLAAAGPDAPRAQRVNALQTALRDAANLLKANPADERLYRVLHRAYLAPSPSLERAAEALGLPSSTFRRYLGLAVGRVVDALWEREVDA